MLLGMYAAGLALPFLVVALVFHRSLIAVRFVRRHSRLLTRFSAVVLAGYGGLLAMNQLSWFTLESATLGDRARLVMVGAPRLSGTNLRRRGGVDLRGVGTYGLYCSSVLAIDSRRPS